MLILTGCAAAPSATPSGESLPTATSSPSESAVPSVSQPSYLPPTGTWIGFRWPIRDVELASTGAIYVSEWDLGETASAIHRLNANGQESPGWPIETEGAPDLLMDGTSLMAGVCTTGPTPGPCQLHRFREDGTEAQGFPVRLPAGCFNMQLAWNTAIVLECYDDDDARLVAVDRTGHLLNGWPKRLRGFSSSGIAADGLVYALSRPTREEQRIDVFELNGGEPPGWPVHMPLTGNAFGISGLQPHPTGFLMVWGLEGVVPDQICLEADRTSVTVLASDGRVMPDWPIQMDGVGSRPAVASSGASWLRAGGEQHRIAGFDAQGRPMDGWPIEVPADACLPSGPASVSLLEDGARVALVESSTISLWTPDGSVIPGWPLTVDGRLAGGCQPSPCMPGGNGAIAPVVTHRDSAMYLVTYAGDRPETMQAQVVAFDTDGQLVLGFPLPIPELPCYPDVCPFAAPQVIDVQLTIDERVVVIASEGLFIVQ